MTTFTTRDNVEVQIKRKYEMLTEKLREASADIEKYQTQLNITKKGISHILTCLLTYLLTYLVYVCMYVYMYICMFICMYVCMYV